MGKPVSMNDRDTPTQVGERTRGSKTFQYPEEKKPIGISLVAASEKESA